VISNPQSLNKYTYTWNNPQRYTDPDGHNVFLVAAVVAAAWATFEVGSAIADVDAAIDTLGDSGASTFEKLTTTGLAAASILGPGGGYAAGFRFGRVGGRIAGIFNKVDNIISDQLDAKSVSAAVREIGGEVVKVKPGTSQAFDHVKKVEQGLAGLRNQVQKMQDLLKNGNLSEKAKNAVRKKLSEASKKADEVEEELRKARKKKSNPRSDAPPQK
jgi:hypothetical protein